MSNDQKAAWKISHARRQRAKYERDRESILEKRRLKRLAGEIKTPDVVVKRRKANKAHIEVMAELKAMAGREQTPEDFEKLMRMMGGEP